MEEKGLSTGLLLKKSCRIFLRNWLIVIFTLVVSMAILSLPMLIEYLLAKPSSLVIALLQLGKTLFSVWMFLGLLKIYIRLAKEEKPSFFDLFRGFPMILNFLVSKIIFLVLLFVVLLVATLAGEILFFINEKLFLGNPFPGIDDWIATVSSPFVTIPNEALTFLSNAFDSLDQFIRILPFTVIFFGAFIWMTCRFLLMPFFIVDYYEGPIEALKMSARASKGAIWDIMLLIFAVFLLFLIGQALLGIGLIVALPLGLIALSLAYTELVETTTWE